MSLAGLALAGVAWAGTHPPLPPGTPAVRIKVPQPQLGGAAAIGAGPIAIRYAFWDNDASFVQDQASGLFVADLHLRPNYELETIGNDDFLFGFLAPVQASQVGDLVLSGALQPDLQQGGDANLHPMYWERSECFVPLYKRALQSDEKRVCAFVRVRITQIPPPNGEDPNELFLRVTKLPNTLNPGEPWIALRNASSQMDGNQDPVVFAGTNLGWWTLRELLFSLPVAGSNSVLIPDSRVYVP